MKTTLIVIFLVFSTAGCNTNTHETYEWYRNTNEIFELQWKFNAGNLVTLNTYIEKRQSTSDKENHIKGALPKLTNKSQTYINDYWTRCTYFDERNWNCTTMAPDKESIEMKNGELTWYYWGEVRKYRKKSKIWSFY
jgi:hypothetical protein